MDTIAVFNSLKVVGLTGHQVAALIDGLSRESIDICINNDMLPDIGAYCYDFIEAISKRTDRIPILYKFLAPKLFNTKLDDVPESKFTYSHYLSDADCTYYLQDTNIYKLTKVMLRTKHSHRLGEIIPRLTPHTPYIIDILARCICAGVDVKSLADKCIVYVPNHLSANHALLMFYTNKSYQLAGKTIADNSDKDIPNASSEYVRLMELVKKHRSQQIREYGKV